MKDGLKIFLLMSLSGFLSLSVAGAGFYTGLFYNSEVCPVCQCIAPPQPVVPCEPDCIEESQREGFQQAPPLEEEK